MCCYINGQGLLSQKLFQNPPPTSITLWSKQINNLRGTTNPIQFVKFNNVPLFPVYFLVVFALNLENKIMQSLERYFYSTSIEYFEKCTKTYHCKVLVCILHDMSMTRKG